MTVPEYGGSMGNIVAAVLWKNTQKERRAQEELDAKYKNRNQKSEIRL